MTYYSTTQQSETVPVFYFTLSNLGSKYMILVVVNSNHNNEFQKTISNIYFDYINRWVVYLYTRIN